MARGTAHSGLLSDDDTKKNSGRSSDLCPSVDFFFLLCNVNFFCLHLICDFLQSCFDSGNESFSRSKSCRLQKHDAAFYSRANRLSSKGKFDKICVVSHFY